MSGRTNRINFLLDGSPVVATTLKMSKPEPLVGCGSTDGFDSLWRLNIAAAVLHGVFAIMTLAVGLAGNSPFQVVVTRNLPIVPNPIPFPFNSTQCGGESYDDVFKWFKCIRENFEDDYKVGLVQDFGYSVISEESGAPDTIMPPFQTTYLLTDEWQMWTLIFAFCLLTSLSHALIAWPLREAYEYWLTRDTQPLRYFEYSITASIMFVIVLTLTRVTDIYLLLANALLMFCVNVFGGVLEWVTLGLPLDFTPRPSTIRAWAWAASALVFVFQFWQLWDIYDRTVEPWLDTNNETSELMAQLFGFVTILNAVILACFLTFPVVNMVQFLYYTNGQCRACLQRASKDDLYFALRFEAAYVFCSLVAKAALVIIVFVAAVQRGN